jgi:F-type H+-transporting ATPase subunit delta
MNDSKISVRYARALFQSALEKKLIDRVYNDMGYIAELCRIHEVRELLISPVIPPAKKREIMHELVEKEIDKITLSFVDLVITNTRESYLPAISRVFLSDTLKYKGITETVLTTAVRTDDNVKKQISDLVASAFDTKVELKEIIDKDILGGFILRIDDKMIDASIRNKLRKIEKELRNKPVTA